MKGRKERVRALGLRAVGHTVAEREWARESESEKKERGKMDLG